MKTNPIHGFSGVALAMMAASLAISTPTAAFAKSKIVADVSLVHSRTHRRTTGQS